MKYKKAIVKFNNGNGALLCNDCDTIVSEGFGFEDKYSYCEECAKAFPEEREEWGDG